MRPKDIILIALFLLNARIKYDINWGHKRMKTILLFFYVHLCIYESFRRLIVTNYQTRTILF